MTTKPRQVDMSPTAVARRIEDIRQLYRLGMSLMRAGREAGLHHRGMASPVSPKQ
jgi:hypothetical protein